MTELLFFVEEDPDGGLTGRALGESIFVEADSMDALREQVRDAISCHFDAPARRPKSVRLHFVRDEVLAL